MSRGLMAVSTSVPEKNAARVGAAVMGDQVGGPRILGLGVRSAV
jgi:hypothetical protein